MIEANPNITLNRLKAFISKEFLIPDSFIDGAVAALCNKQLLNLVSRWQHHNNVNTDKGIHLTVRDPQLADKWLYRFLVSSPFLSTFQPTILTTKRSLA